MLHTSENRTVDSHSQCFTSQQTISVVSAQTYFYGWIYMPTQTSDYLAQCVTNLNTVPTLEWDVLHSRFVLINPKGLYTPVTQRRYTKKRCNYFTSNLFWSYRLILFTLKNLPRFEKLHHLIIIALSVHAWQTAA